METPLQFPTKAEQAKAALETKKFASVKVLAAQFGAYTKEYEYPETRYIFEDDTALVVTGTGKSHKLETRLP